VNTLSDSEGGSEEIEKDYGLESCVYAPVPGPTSFEELDEMKKSEIILSEIGSLRKLMLKTSELNLSKLIVVGYGQIDSDIFFKMAIDVDFNSLLKLPGNLNLYFSDLYFGGITRGYRNNIVPHQTIYEL
jgi:hypothetical protein